MISTCKPDGEHNITVRPAAEKDAVELRRLNALFNGVRDVGIESIAFSIRSNNNEQVFVAEQCDRLIGFCCVQIYESFCYTCKYAEITELYVEEPFRRKGVATRLVAFAENHCSNGRIGRFHLRTGCRNTSAQKFYESVGYEKTDEYVYKKTQCT